MNQNFVDSVQSKQETELNAEVNFAASISHLRFLMYVIIYLVVNIILIGVIKL